jgi:hypothetical protein
LAADDIYTAEDSNATTDTEVRCEQYCSHRAFFGSCVADLISGLDVDNEQVGFAMLTPRLETSKFRQEIKCARIKS